MAYGFWVIASLFRRSLDTKRRGYFSLIALYYGKIDTSFIDAFNIVCHFFHVNCIFQIAFKFSILLQVHRVWWVAVLMVLLVRTTQYHPGAGEKESALHLEGQDRASQPSGSRQDHSQRVTQIRAFTDTKRQQIKSQFSDHFQQIHNQGKSLT